MNNIVELLNDNFLDIVDYEKIKKICDEKIMMLNVIDNIIYINDVQNSKYNSDVLLLYNKYFSKCTKKKWDEFINTDFCNDINDGVIKKENFCYFCNKIKKLDFTNSCVSYYNEISMKSTILKIENNSEICIEINLANNCISDEGLDIIIPILKKCNALQILNISNNCISDIGLRKIKQLSNITTLKKIMLHENYGPSENTLKYLLDDWNIKLIF